MYPQLLCHKVGILLKYFMSLIVDCLNVYWIIIDGWKPISPSHGSTSLGSKQAMNRAFICENLTQCASIILRG